MEVKGRFKLAKDEQVINEKFTKREFVITTEEDYPQSLSFQLVNDKCSIVDGYKEGEIINVHIYLRGREWTSPQGEVKYFNTLEAWKIEKIGQEQQKEEVKDDLPF